MTRKPAELKDEEIAAAVYGTHDFKIGYRAIATAATRKALELSLHKVDNWPLPSSAVPEHRMLVAAIRKEIP